MPRIDEGTKQATGAQDYCKALVNMSKGRPFVVIDAMTATGLDAAKTLAILEELHVLGCCQGPVNDGGINLFVMSAAEVRRYRGD